MTTISNLLGATLVVFAVFAINPDLYAQRDRSPYSPPRMDRNNDGRIDAREYRTHRRSEPQRIIPINAPGGNRADLDGDGSVSDEERKLSRMNLDARTLPDNSGDSETELSVDADAGVEEALEEVKKKDRRKPLMDRNNDGVVEEWERQSYQSRRPVRIDSGDFKGAKEYDSNADKHLDRHERQEMFKDELRKIKNAGPRDANNKFLRQFDLDDDGKIDRDESDALKDVINGGRK